MLPDTSIPEAKYVKIAEKPKKIQKSKMDELMKSPNETKILMNCIEKYLKSKNMDALNTPEEIDKAAISISQNMQCTNEESKEPTKVSIEEVKKSENKAEINENIAEQNSCINDDALLALCNSPTKNSNMKQGEPKKEITDDDLMALCKTPANSNRKIAEQSKEVFSDEDLLFLCKTPASSKQKSNDQNKGISDEELLKVCKISDSCIKRKHNQLVEEDVFTDVDLVKMLAE
jgi:hypothetical protein